MNEEIGTCTYCLREGRAKNLTPMYEEGNEMIWYYCPDCLPEVKKNIADLHYRDKIWFGFKGEKKRPPNSS